MTDDELEKEIEQAAKDRVMRLELFFKGLTSLPESIGQLTQLTQLDLSGNRLTSLPESIGQLTQLTQLDLRNNQLTSLPESIGKLGNLRQFHLRDNQLTSLPESMGKLTNLTQLDLRSNQLTSLPESMGKLTNLTQLNLRNNQLTSLPESIGQLTRLTKLDLWDNKLTSLPSEIGQLTRLGQFDLSDNQLTSLPEWMEQLSHLTRLNLRNNQLTSLPEWMGQLTNLTQLDLRYNHLTSLPEWMGQLTNLIWLNLRYNHLTSLPEWMGQLTNLTQLDLSSNRLTSLPEWMGQLTNLTQLDFGGNQLMNLPESIGQLNHLTWLNLRGNQLTSLPKSMGQLNHLTWLNLSGNPLTSLPPEIRQKEGLEILNFYRQQLEQKIDRLYEAKLLIVGEGGAGKTTLAKKIQDSDYQLRPEEESTEGIDVIRWQFPLQDGKEFRINIWDFGGQEIYHATHQFFLTKRSLYALVADTRKENTDFYYWLNVVELLSSSSPLLIVKNEKQERKREINERQLRGEFTNLKETLAANFATNRGLPEILTNIQHYIQSLPHVGAELPKTWVRVREALEQDDRNHISLEEYLKICTDNGFTRRDDALQLSSYLHDLGVCLHFQEDDLLIRTVILKPTWGTDAVYKVLDNAQVVKNLGKFTRDDLKAIWHEDKYAAMRPELLRLMMNFKLCYQIPNCGDVYIAPQLLTPNQSEYAWDKSDNLFLRYEYEFMPKGILTRFIVETHPWIENQTCVWKTGVVLSKDGARAEVIELYRYHKGEIRIRVTGKRKRDLLTTVRHELDKIHRSYERLKYKTLVPCNCSTCKSSPTPFFYNLERLNHFLDTGKPRIQCYESGDDVEVRGLIDDITESRSRSTQPMSEASKYSIKADVVQITEQNLGEVIAKKYASDPAFKETLTEILQILSNLQQNHPTATEAEAEEIIEAEFEEIKTKQPHKWQTFRRQLLNRERWFNGGKEALKETAKHYADNNVFYKAGLAFLEGFSADDD